MGARGGRLAFLLPLAVALLYAGPGLLPGRVLLPLDLVADTGAWKPDPNVRVPISNRLLSDAVLQFHPWDLEVRRALSEGRFPWINPYAGEGAPLFANPATGLLSPFTWPRLAFGEWGWGLSVLLRLVVAGLGLYRLARRLGIGSSAALICGLVYETSGASIVWALHPHTNVFAFLPWLADATLGSLRRPSAGSALTVVAFAAIATAGGHPETLAFGVVGLAIWGAWNARSSGPGRARVGLAVSAAACGFFLLGVVLVPFAFLLARSETAAVRASAEPGGLRLVAAAAQVLPGFLGSPLRGEIDLSGAVAGAENFNTRSQGFVGLLALAAVVCGFRRLEAPLRRGLVVGALFLAVAWRIPPLGSLWSALPGVCLIAPEYAAFVFVFFASLASGPAFEALARSEKARRRLGVGLLLCGALLVGGGTIVQLPTYRRALLSVARLGIQKLRERGHLLLPAAVYESRIEGYLSTGKATALRRVALPGLIWVAGGAAILARRRRFSRGLAAAAVAELIAFGAGYLPSVRFRDVPGTPPSVAALVRRAPDPSVMFAAIGDVYPPDLGTTERLRDARSYDLLESRAWIARLARCGYDSRARAFPESLTAERVTCLRKAGVRYVLSRGAPPGSARVGGGSPPAVGAYELPAAAAAPVLPEGPPPGFGIGVAMSLVGAAGALAVARTAAGLAKRSPL